VRYRSSSVFSLGQWSDRFPTGLACPVVLRIRLMSLNCAYRAVTLCRRSSRTVRLRRRSLPAVLQPRLVVQTVWAAPRSLATTGGIISFPRGTEMFQFPRFPARARWRGVTRAVFPHSDIDGSCGCIRLTVACRSMPRPSSALDARTSTMSPYYLPPV
jgi:hypothetical protein